MHLQSNNRARCNDRGGDDRLVENVRQGDGRQAGKAVILIAAYVFLYMPIVHILFASVFNHPNFPAAVRYSIGSGAAWW